MKSKPFRYIFRNIDVDHYFNIYLWRKPKKIYEMFVIQENISETVICKMEAILFKLQ